MTDGMTTVERDAAMFAALSVSEDIIAKKAAEFVQVRQVEETSSVYSGGWLVTCIGMTIAHHETEEDANRFAKQERSIVKGKLREFVFDLKAAEGK